MKNQSTISPSSRKYGLENEKKNAIRIAMELGYPQKTIDAIYRALGTAQITNALVEARHEWDVQPGRKYINPYTHPETYKEYEVEALISTPSKIRKDFSKMEFKICDKVCETNIQESKGFLEMEEI